MSGLAMSGKNKALFGGDEVTPQIGGDEPFSGNVFGGDEPNAIGGDEGAPAFI